MIEFLQNVDRILYYILVTSWYYVFPQKSRFSLMESPYSVIYSGDIMEVTSSTKYLCEDCVPASNLHFTLPCLGCGQIEALWWCYEILEKKNSMKL